MHAVALAKTDVYELSLSWTVFSKGFPQSEVLGEVSVLEGGVQGEVFAKFAAKFFTKFSGLLCWDIQSKKNFSKNFSPKFP